jgi:hypothetical protein
MIVHGMMLKVEIRLSYNASHLDVEFQIFLSKLYVFIILWVGMHQKDYSNYLAN